MPNIKSAIKRVSVNERKRVENRALKSELATAIKKFKATVLADVDKAEALYADTVSIIDGACSKGIIHKNNADRKKAKLANMLNKAKLAKQA